VKTLDYDTLPNLSQLLASAGWIITEFKVEASNVIGLRIVYEGKSEEKEGEKE
jgi:hypothetical protein